MLLAELLQQHLPLALKELDASTPAEYMSRQAWQENVEAVVADVRSVTRKPAFGLSEAEITVHYHLPLQRFTALLQQRLGLRSAS